VVLGEGTEIARTPSRALNASPFRRALRSAHPPSARPASPPRSRNFAVPILHSDRLGGKVDAKADRKASVFRVNAIHRAWSSRSVRSPRGRRLA